MGGRGSSSGSKGGGGGAVASEETKQPLEGGVKLRVVMNDGSTQEVEVSIQDTSQYDNLQGKDYVRGRDRYAQAPVDRVLASDAENNAVEGKEAYMTEPSAKEGKWSKTDSVPMVTHTNHDTWEIGKASGYVTSANGETIYVQQRGRGDWVLNYKGVIAGKSYKNAKAAQADVGNLSNLLSNNSRIVSSSKAQFDALNYNKGRVSEKVFKEINMNYIANKKGY